MYGFNLVLFCELVIRCHSSQPENPLLPGLSPPCAREWNQNLYVQVADLNSRVLFERWWQEGICGKDIHPRKKTEHGVWWCESSKSLTSI